MAVVIDPKLIALLQKLEADGLNDLGLALVPALLAEVRDLSPSPIQGVEDIIFGAIQPQLQAALVSLLAKVPSI